jgi:hypothetical protein
MTNGYATIIPVIMKVQFTSGKIHLKLKDGREIITPVNKFPSIQKLSNIQRTKYQILDGIGIAFDALDETFHISQFLGEENKTFDTKIRNQTLDIRKRAKA